MKNTLDIPQIKRWVIKIGSAMLTAGGKGLDVPAIEDWARQIAALENAGKQCVLVSSGTIAVGMRALGWHKRPTELAELQTAAAVGQMALARAWEEAFAKYQVRVAQVLLTHEDASDRRRYLNIRSTIRTMCDNHIVPVVNENDTVSYEEIRFGDNDTLGAMVANITVAGGYIILTDQPGMFTKNPREYKDAKLLSAIDVEDSRLEQMAGKTGGVLGSGGMFTKVIAARKAARSGTHTFLAYGLEENVITRITQGETIGTHFIASEDAQQARKQWLGGQLQVQGTLWLDAGAAKALVEQNRSLLPIGVTKVDGDFARGELIRCCDAQGKELARGLSNYDAKECRLFCRKHSSEIQDFLIHGETLIHRDNLITL